MICHIGIFFKEKTEMGMQNEEPAASPCFTTLLKCSYVWQNSLSASADTGSNLTVLRHPDLPLTMINVE